MKDGHYSEVLPFLHKGATNALFLRGPGFEGFSTLGMKSCCSLPTALALVRVILGRRYSRDNGSPWDCTLLTA